MEFVVTYAWVGALLFARIGAVLMLAPGFGESAIPVRFRLTIAFLATIALAPPLVNTVPPQPDTLGGVISLVVLELLIGGILGAVARIFMSAMAVAGQAIAMQTGLGFAMQLDPTVGQQGALLGAFLSLLAVVLVFSFGIHHWMLEAAADSYGLFPIGTFPLIGDTAQYAVTALAESFRLGIQIAAPAIAFALIFNLALGLVNRLIPQIQIFFVALPSSILLGLTIVALGMGAGMISWLEGFDNFLRMGGY